LTTFINENLLRAHSTEKRAYSRFKFIESIVERLYIFQHHMEYLVINHYTNVLLFLGGLLGFSWLLFVLLGLSLDGSSGLSCLLSCWLGGGLSGGSLSGSGGGSLSGSSGLSGILLTSLGGGLLVFRGSLFGLFGSFSGSSFSSFLMGIMKSLLSEGLEELNVFSGGLQASLISFFLFSLVQSLSSESNISDESLDLGSLVSNFSTLFDLSGVEKSKSSNIVFLVKSEQSSDSGGSLGTESSGFLFIG